MGEEALKAVLEGDGKEGSTLGEEALEAALVGGKEGPTRGEDALETALGGGDKVKKVNTTR